MRPKKLTYMAGGDDTKLSRGADRSRPGAAAGSRGSAQPEPKRSRMPSTAASRRESFGAARSANKSGCRSVPTGRPSRRRAIAAPHRAGRRARRASRRRAAARDDGGVLGGRLEHALAGIGLEIGAPDLDRHPAGGKTLRHAVARRRGRRAPSNAARARAASRMSSAKVSSALMDFSSRSATTGRSSMPRAQRPHGPAVLAEGAPQHLHRSPARRRRTVRMPAACTAGQGFSVRLRTSRSMGKRSSTSCRFSGPMRNMPSGLFKSEAILASSLLGAIPTEAVSSVAARIRRRISAADRSGIAEQAPARGDVQKRLVQRQSLAPAA